MAAQVRTDQIRDLVNQWEQLTGFTVSVADWMVWEMANNVTVAGFVTSLFDVGQYMLAHTAPGQYNLVWMDAPFQPWAWYGMSATEYDTKMSSFDSAYEQLTGQHLPPSDGHGNLADQAFKQFGGTMTGPQFQTFLLSQDSVRSTYGWVKYGIDYQQFQAQKLQMQTPFGRPLTDQEAVTQLQYLHAAQGPNVSVGVQPTLTQVERKQAQIGVGQSEVR